MGTSGHDGVPPNRESPDVDQAGDLDGEDLLGELLPADLDEEINALTESERGDLKPASPCSSCGLCSAAVVEEAVGELDRANAERALFELLLEHDVQGPVWETTVGDLAAYGVQVLKAWIQTDEIYSKLGSKLRGLASWPAARERLATDRAYRDDIIDNTIAGALDKLRKGLRDRTGWDPCRGLKLRSYFINGCLDEFKNVFENDLRWWRTHQTSPVEYADLAELVGLGFEPQWGSRLSIDPAITVTERMVISGFLSTLSSTDKIIVFAVAEGYKYAEIAHLFPNKTSKAIERRMSRLRKQARLYVRNQ
ncbi:hypothetical protein AB0M12_40465 [Nocardia vinacea]|uniref:hypothetical protein n=1 Tax=Nocardia vinacea TaxID=96468 RepID=UPI003437EE4C